MEIQEGNNIHNDKLKKEFSTCHLIIGRKRRKIQKKAQSKT